MSDSDSPEALLAPLEWFSMRLGLDRMQTALDRLGHPERGLPIVLVAGTNGKGSVAVMVDSIVGVAGYRTGLFTSPHLESVRERVRVDGLAVSSAELAGDIAAVQRDTSGIELTYFETLTLAALVCFRRRRVDLAVLEVGLGGRLDATNATSPILSLVTSLGLDHTELLGDTIEEIAREKAGIARRGVPLCHLVGAGAAEVGSVAREIGAIPIAVEPDGDEVEWEAGSVRIDSKHLAAHERANARIAAVAARELRSRGFPDVTEGHLVRGLAASCWPGRRERISVAGRRMMLDGAHNPAAIDALLASVDGPLDVLFACYVDKAAVEMTSRLRGRADRFVISGFDHPRAADPRQVAGEVAGEVQLHQDPVAGLAALLDGSSDRLAVVTGSIAFVGQIRSELRRQFGSPPPAADVSVRAGCRLESFSSGDEARIERERAGQ